MPLGDVTSMTDRNANTHAYSFDALGRPTSDSVTTLGSGVDGNVRRYDTSYDTGDRDLDRLTDFRRGTVSASGGAGTTLDTVSTLNSNTNIAGSQSFTLDRQGNTSSLLTNGSTTQTRTANAQTASRTRSITSQNVSSLGPPPASCLLPPVSSFSPRHETNRHYVRCVIPLTSQPPVRVRGKPPRFVNPFTQP